MGLKRWDGLGPRVDPVPTILIVLAAAGAGSCAGVGTGLVPGVHVNNVALLVLTLEPAIVAALASAVDAASSVLLLAAFLAAASVAHGIASLLPSVFLGAPEAETALSVLPGHRLLAQGRGFEAVVLGARGAFLGTLLALPLLVPLRLFLGDPVDAYDRLRPLLPFFLLLLVAILIATEGGSSESMRGRKRVWAVGLLLLAGILGALVLRAGFLRDGWRPLPVGGDSLVLFPLFTGLFGLPTLLLSMRNRGRLPPQILGLADPLPDWRRTRGLLSGTVAGAAVSWFPGLGGANATVIAQLLAGGEPKEGDPDADREFLFAVGATGSATTVFTFATLFVILRARSGVAAAVDALADRVPPWDPVTYMPPLLAAMLLALVVAAALGYTATVLLARPFARFAGRIRYGRLAAVVAACLAAGVFLATGPVGLLVLGTATGLGLVPPLVGVRRVHLMGCLLIPLVFGVL